MVAPAVAAGDARPGRGRAGRGPAHRLGRPVDEQRAYLDDFWDGADVEIEGDAELQQAIRFALFHIPAGRRPHRAARDPGQGADRARATTDTRFWDTETFVLPVLTYTAPGAARRRAALAPLAPSTWRASARAQLGSTGAAFPWRTIRGQECSGYWPAGTAAFHINADIADAVVRYQFATGDEKFERDFGLELLVETARLWRSLGHHDAAGRFRIDGVTGPDEYCALADNNVYTNLMAQRNLRAAADDRRAPSVLARRRWASTTRSSPPGATPPRR